MKKVMGLKVPSHLNEWVAYSGLALVVFSALDMPAFWPQWAIPAIGAFIGFYIVGDAKTFLLAGLALMGAKWGLGHLPIVGRLAQDLVQGLTALVAPAMLVVSVRLIIKEIKG